MVGEQLPPQWNRPGAPDTHGLIETPPLDLEHGGDLLAREGQTASGLCHELAVLALAGGGQALARASVGVRQGDGQLRGQAAQELALTVGQVKQPVRSETGSGDTAVTELGLTPAPLCGHCPSEQVGEASHPRQAVLGRSRDDDLKGLGGRVRGDGGQHGLGLGAPCGVAAQGAPGGGGETLALHPDGEGEQPLVPQALPLAGLAIVGDPALDDEGTERTGLLRTEQAQVELDGAGPVRGLESVGLKHPVPHDVGVEQCPVGEPRLGQGLEGEPVQGHRRALQSPPGRRQGLCDDEVGDVIPVYLQGAQQVGPSQTVLLLGTGRTQPGDAVGDRQTGQPSRPRPAHVSDRAHHCFKCQVPDLGEACQKLLGQLPVGLRAPHGNLCQRRHHTPGDGREVGERTQHSRR